MDRRRRDAPSIVRGSLWLAVASGIVMVLTLIGLAAPMYTALRADNGQEGACLARHAQSATGAIQDLPTSVQTDWLRATLVCDWPTAGDGTTSQTFELAPSARQNALLVVCSLAAVGLVAGLAHAAWGTRRAVTRT